ncbi:MAG: response regulator [Anaerolineae bacterium]|nr:response regulator [Anaerolineae bacterium]
MPYRGRVLIVDDEPGGRETLEALLLREGYELLFAANGEEALDKAARHLPDLVLLDVMMPGMDGFEVCRRLRADTRLAEIPVILVTALDDRESRLEGIEAGADDFVSKPFDRVELRTRVRTIVRLNRYRRLLLERAKFEWAVEQADDGYLVLSESDEVLYLNPRARLYLGLPPTDEAHTPVETFLALARKQYHCEPQEAWVSWPRPPVPPDTPRYLVRPRTPTSSEFWLQVHVTEIVPLTEQRYLVRLRDVTADAIGQLNMWSFQGLVNHKLRTSVSLLVGFMDILQEDLPAGLDPELKTYCAMIGEGIKRLKDDIFDVLSYVNLTDTPLTEEEHCPLTLFAELVGKVSTAVGIEKCSFSYEGPDSSALSVPLAPQVVELILLELLGNSRKFHPRKAPTVEVRLAASGGKVRLQVCDDGLTLAPDQLTRIWTPYYQAEDGFSGAVPGMGLGLPMVATLVWRVGGTCRAYNRADGPGLVIELLLPTEGQ